MNSDAANSFIDQYRQAYEKQYQSAQDTLKQQRSNDFATMMGEANRAGSMYSNIPERNKVIYDTKTYYPGLIKAFTTYQTGIDKLRNNVVNYQNQIKSLNDAINDLNQDKIINSSYY